MYNNNIVNFQESTTILNACTKKKSGNVLNALRKYGEMEVNPMLYQYENIKGQGIQRMIST